MKKVEESILLSDELSRHILGNKEANGLELIRSLPEIAVHARGNKLTVSGGSEMVERVKSFIESLSSRVEAGELLDAHDLRYLFLAHAKDKYPKCKEPFEEILVTYSGRSIKPKTFNQHLYAQAMSNREITVSIGPAGTGKTYLAIGMAVRALRDKQVSRIILSRPTIEAGESLGFLPGDILEKVDPYFRPLYDALQEFLGPSRFRQLIDRGTIEINPLAFMRGRTFSDAFIILDEAQNTTNKQMRMFLTRMGIGSKVVVAGDQTQIDLPSPTDSGLIALPSVLSKIGRVAFVHLAEEDVIRHDLVREIVKAYEIYSQRNERKGKGDQDQPL
ncbi:PhoH family protein [bacterium]|nr:PhoH family protein [bacterium]